MKNSGYIISYAFVFVSIFSLAWACSGPSGSGTSGAIDNGVVKFKLDGVDWISGPPGHPEMKYEEEAITDGSTLVRVEALAEDMSYIAFNIYRDSSIGSGTYPIMDKGMLGFFEQRFGEGDGYVTNGMDSNPGSVTIISMTDEKVTGRFSFLVRNSGDPDDVKNITDGTFDIRFSKY